MVILIMVINITAKTSISFPLHPRSRPFTAIISVAFTSNHIMSCHFQYESHQLTVRTTHILSTNKYINLV